MKKTDWVLITSVEIRIYGAKTLGREAPKEYKRVVLDKGAVIYQDEMPARMYWAASDPIRKMFDFLLGLKERKSANDTRGDGGNLIGRFKKAWREFVGKGS